MTYDHTDAGRSPMLEPECPDPMNPDCACPACERTEVADPGTIAARLRDLIPQMLEDAECHRSWTTPAAQAEMAQPSTKPLKDHVGDTEWHTRWAAFYDEVAQAMADAASVIEELIEEPPWGGR